MLVRHPRQSCTDIIPSKHHGISEDTGYVTHLILVKRKQAQRFKLTPGASPRTSAREGASEVSRRLHTDLVTRPRR